MNAFAQNASAGGGGGGYATLSGSLLARKGEALPAVDAVAHEGVDIEMRPMRPANSPGAPKNISEDAIGTLRPHQRRESPDADHALKPQATEPRNQVRLVHSAPEKSTESDFRPTPDAWTIMSPQRLKEGRPLPSQHKLTPPPARPRPDVNGSKRSAICKLRMPAPDLVRLRFASRDMEMSCQAIILEALECYLDANDIPPITDEEIQAEVERLLSKAKVRR
jgi:hypothetical protein